MHSALGVFDDTLDGLLDIFRTILGLLAEALICKRPSVQENASGLSSTNTEEEEVYSCEAADHTMLVTCQKSIQAREMLTRHSGA